MKEEVLRDIIYNKLSDKDLINLLFEDQNGNKQSIQDLLSFYNYVVIKDKSYWRDNKELFSVDIIGGMVPGLAISEH